VFSTSLELASHEWFGEVLMSKEAITAPSNTKDP